MAPTDSHDERPSIRRFLTGPPVMSWRGQVPVVLASVLMGALIGDLVSGGATGGLLLGASIGNTVAVGLSQIVGRLIDAAGRLPDWARWAEPIEPRAIDYSVPPPVDGPIFNGRADQALLQRWLQRRRARR